MTKVEGIVNAEVRSGGSGGSGGFGEETPVRAVVIRGTTEVKVLDAGIDKLSITWKLSSTAKKQANFATIKVNLCYAPVSQVDRPWRRTENELFKDKTCPHKIITRAYNKSSQSFKYTLDCDIPTGTYFVHTYAVDAKDYEVPFGQSTNEAKTTNLFSVQAISGRHKSLDIASVCFSVFSVLALLVFFVNEKRKAKLEQSK